MKFLIAGLGNIGLEYEHTRHNIGFDIVEQLAANHETGFLSDRLASRAELKIKGRTLILIKPTTYMNLSGKAINYWLQAEKIKLENMLVVTDDIALAVGAIRIRTKGSDGGHNGLSNIIETLQSNEFARLRFGVGNNFAKGRQVEYVLGRWNADEEKIVQEKIKIACKAIEGFATIGVERTMNLFNSK